jgi:Capsule assembly protein Wzi
MNRFIGLLLFLLPFSISAQVEGVLQMNDEIHQFLLRQQANGLLPDAFLSTQPLSAKEVNRYLSTLNNQKEKLSTEDSRFLSDIQAQTTDGKVRLKHLPLYTMAGADYRLSILPQFYLSAGSGQFSVASGDSSGIVSQNARGLRVNGHIGERLSFDTGFTTNDERVGMPVYRNAGAERIGVPGGVKINGNRFDYYKFSGNVVYSIPHIEVRLGHDQNRWSNGVNSVLLSNYAPEYGFLQIKTQLGRIQYTNLYTGFNDLSRWNRGCSCIVPRKYGAFHKLDIRINKRLSIELFEAIISAPDSSGSNKRRFGFDLAYLNPVLFYRAAEHDRGSADNALVGAAFAYRPSPKIQTYGQFILDEFTFAEIKANNGYWANKWGVLGGLYTTLIPKTDLRIEATKIRPYTYAHRISTTAYIHNDDNLGHQGGPNSKNLSVFLNTQISPKLAIAADYTYRDRGRNNALNYGADPRLSNRTIFQTHGNFTTQGVKEKTHILASRISYNIFEGLFGEGGLTYHKVEDAVIGVRKMVLPFAQLRWGMPFKYIRH